jgi:hypothetical protein
MEGIAFIYAAFTKSVQKLKINNLPEYQILSGMREEKLSSWLLLEN